MKRRHFLKNAALTSAGIAVGSTLLHCAEKTSSEKTKPLATASEFPLVIATWNVTEATAKAMEILRSGGSALDAVEKGCNVEEGNENAQTVGKGGLPDSDGKVTLDACIMDPNGNCGAVACLQDIPYAVSVARKVMEKTPHVMLSGEGAKAFALTQGFSPENLLTDASKKAWEEWKIHRKYQPIINIENHDTIGMLAIDKNGAIAGACTTSGLAFKMPGRIGDSPIIGSGLYIDNAIGGCVASGLGESIMKTVGSFLVVELMRQGKSPQEACKVAIERIVNLPNSDYKNFQVGYVAVNKRGETGSYAIHQGFGVSKFQKESPVYLPADFYIKS